MVLLLDEEGGSYRVFEPPAIFPSHFNPCPVQSMVMQLRVAKILVSSLFLIILFADIAMLILWQRLLVLLGPVLGLELGILIFVNLLVGLLVLDLLEHRFRMPGLNWFYDLPARRCEGMALNSIPVSRTFQAYTGRRFWSRLFINLISLTLIFYTVETLLLPFVPIHGDLQYEAFLAGGIILWKTRRRSIT